MSRRALAPALRFASVLALLPVLTLPLLAVPAHADHPPSPDAVVKQLAGELMCQCGCGLTLANCTHATCGPRDSMLAEIRRLAAQGQTADQIRATFVAQFGEVVLAAPPRRGLNLLAWWGPYVALLAGAAAVLLLGAAWVRRPGEPEPAQAAPLSHEQREWLEGELRKTDA